MFFRAFASILLLTQLAIALPSGDSSLYDRDTSQSDIQQYLSTHNAARAQHGANPVTYNQKLAEAAESWANRCIFQHSGGTLGPFGENLAAGSGNFEISDAVNSWVQEVSQYDPKNPQPSHFTQVVWKNTKEIGCARAHCPSGSIFQSLASTYYVCEYSPAGNVIGQFTQNVQK